MWFSANTKRVQELFVSCLQDPNIFIGDSSLSLGDVGILFAFIFLKYLAGKMIVEKSYRKLIQQFIGNFIYSFFLFADSL